MFTVKRRSSTQHFDLHGRVRMQFFFQAEDGIRDLVRSRGLGDVYKRQVYNLSHNFICLCSTDMFPRGVSTTRRVHVRVCALERRMSAHFSN